MENKSKLNESKFSPLFGDWWPKIKPFFYEGRFDPIFKELKSLSARGKKIFPSSENVFRALWRYCSCKKHCMRRLFQLFVVSDSPFSSFLFTTFKTISAFYFYVSKSFVCTHRRSPPILSIRQKPLV